MRVAIITPGFSADDRDWCVPAVTATVRELSRRHEVRVLALRYPSWRGTRPVHGVTVHALAGAGARGLARLALLARARARLLGEHRDRPFEAVHGLWADEAGFLAAHLGRRWRVPAVVSLLGGELVGLREIGYGTGLSLAGRALVRQALRGAHAVTVGSLAMGRLAARHVPPARLTLAPLGIDLDRFRPEGPAGPALAGQPSLLHVGSLVPVKDQPTLLRAFARVASDATGARLHVVGAGPRAGELAALADALGVASRVTFHGAVPHELMPRFYRAADLCVLSSRFESQSMVALEAAACGRATVGTSVGLLGELVDPDLLAPVGDPSALARAIAALVHDRERRERLARRCLQAAHGRYALSVTVARLEALYATLEGSPAVRARGRDARLAIGGAEP